LPMKKLRRYLMRIYTGRSLKKQRKNRPKEIDIGESSCNWA
jgi:hypothetical protein